MSSHNISGMSNLGKSINWNGTLVSPILSNYIKLCQVSPFRTFKRIVRNMRHQSVKEIVTKISNNLMMNSDMYPFTVRAMYKVAV